MIDEVKKVIIQIRAPKGSFHGEVAEGHYCVVDNAVVLTDPEGKPIDDGKHHLGPGEDARLIACVLVRQRRRNSRAVRGFNDRLSYPKTNY